MKKSDFDVDYSGKTFRNFLVLKRVESTNKKQSRWLVKCSCGNECHINQHSLLRGPGRCLSCAGVNFIDLKGKKFGNLTVLERLPNSKNKQAVWKVKCNCGKEFNVLGGSLRNPKGTRNCLECANKNYSLKRMKEEQAFRAIVYRYKRHAKTRNINFNLSEERIRYLTKQNCYYCNEPPTQINKTYRKNFEDDIYIYNGIDRFDSKGEYNESNCIPCCGFCNGFKSDYEYDYLMKKVMQIYNHSILNKHKEII